MVGDFWCHILPIEMVSLLSKIDFLALLRALVQVLIGMACALSVRSVLGRYLPKYISTYQTTFIQRLFYYGILLIFLIAALNQLGFDMTALVGVTGILTVAVGFASQTAASNVISGLFMLGEKPFQTGDQVEIAGIIGKVCAVDFLSVILKRSDHTIIRIPNTQLLNSILLNHSRSPFRRFDWSLRVSFDQDLEILKRILIEASLLHPDFYKDLQPELSIQEYTENALRVKYSSWVAQDKFSSYERTLPNILHQALQKNQIMIPRGQWDNASD